MVPTLCSQFNASAKCECERDCSLRLSATFSPNYFDTHFWFQQDNSNARRKRPKWRCARVCNEGAGSVIAVCVWVCVCVSMHYSVTDRFTWTALQFVPAVALMFVNAVSVSHCCCCWFWWFTANAMLSGGCLLENSWEVTPKKKKRSNILTANWLSHPAAQRQLLLSVQRLWFHSWVNFCCCYIFNFISFCMLVRWWVFVCCVFFSIFFTSLCNIWLKHLKCSFL